MPDAWIVSSGNRKGIKWIYAENDAEGESSERKDRAREFTTYLLHTVRISFIYLFISVFQPCPHVKALIEDLAIVIVIIFRGIVNLSVNFMLRLTSVHSFQIDICCFFKLKGDIHWCVCVQLYLTFKKTDTVFLSDWQNLPYYSQLHQTPTILFAPSTIFFCHIIIKAFPLSWTNFTNMTHTCWIFFYPLVTAHNLNISSSPYHIM